MVTRVSVRQAIALAACVCALGTLPGCGSQGTASGVGGTSTTLPLVVPPKPPDASVIRAYLSSRNNPVIEFERATRALDVNVSPSFQRCRAIADALSTTRGPIAVESGISHIANVAIQVAVQQDVSAKWMLLSACLEHHVTAADVFEVSRSSKLVTMEFAQLGVAI